MRYVGTDDDGNLSARDASALCELLSATTSAAG